MLKNPSRLCKLYNLDLLLQKSVFTEIELNYFSTANFQETQTAMVKAQKRQMRETSLDKHSFSTDHFEITTCNPPYLCRKIRTLGEFINVLLEQSAWNTILTYVREVTPSAIVSLVTYLNFFRKSEMF